MSWKYEAAALSVPTRWRGGPIGSAVAKLPPIHTSPIVGPPSLARCAARLRQFRRSAHAGRSVDRPPGQLASITGHRSPYLKHGNCNKLLFDRGSMP
jgi:hypothetical protein